VLLTLPVGSAYDVLQEGVLGGHQPPPGPGHGGLRVKLAVTRCDEGSKHQPPGGEPRHELRNRTAAIMAAPPHSLIVPPQSGHDPSRTPGWHTCVVKVIQSSFKAKIQSQITVVCRVNVCVAHLVRYIHTTTTILAISAGCSPLTYPLRMLASHYADRISTVTRALLPEC
jgi:hypothetical protein